MSKQLWNGWRAGCVQVPRRWRRSSRVTQEPARAAYSSSSNAGHSVPRADLVQRLRAGGRRSLSRLPGPSSVAYEPFPNGERSSTRWCSSAHRRPPNQSSRCVFSRPPIGPSCPWVPRSSSLTICIGPTVSPSAPSTIWPAPVTKQASRSLWSSLLGAVRHFSPYAASLEQVLSADRFVGLELGPLGREAGTTLALELAPGLDQDQATLIWETPPVARRSGFSFSPEATDSIPRWASSSSAG